MTIIAVAAPRIVVTGLSHSGLSALAAMLTCGGARCVIVADPHLPPRAKPDSKTIGLWISRNMGALGRARSRGGLPELQPRSLGAIDRLARDVAVRLFAPVFTFALEELIADPAEQSRRLARLLAGPMLADLGAPACPAFDATAAALAIRRIARPASAVGSHRLHLVKAGAP